MPCVGRALADAAEDRVPLRVARVVIQRFWPVITYSSPTLRTVVRMPARRSCVGSEQA